MRMTTQPTYGERLRAARGGLSQTALFQASGVPIHRISGIESDDTRIAYLDAVAISRALGIPLEDLFPVPEPEYISVAVDPRAKV